MTYSEKLKHPKWQKKRLEALQDAGWKCQRCEDSETELHVHHLKYHGDPWDVPLSFLAVLCSMCHESAHELKAAIAPVPELSPSEREIQSVIDQIIAAEKSQTETNRLLLMGMDLVRRKLGMG